MSPVTLAVKAETIPSELKRLRRWVVWAREFVNEKKPKCPFRRGFASVSDSSTWGDFDEALAAYRTGAFAGIGFMLNGDGIVGLDLDHCVTDGVPSDAAMAVLRRTGCSYIELSPSGTGLRGFGYRRGATSRRGEIQGTAVEMYVNRRYLTVTGHTLEAGPLAELTGWEEVQALIRSQQVSPHGTTEETEETEEEEEMDSGSSVASVSSVGGQSGPFDFPKEAMPSRQGQRQHCLFLLARHLHNQSGGANVNDHQMTVKEWHRRVLPVVSTKSWTISWAEFCRGYENVRYRSGQELVSDVLPRLRPPPAHLMGSDDDEVMGKLVSLCVALHEHERGGIFFLPCRVAADVIGTDYRSAAALLKLLVTRGVLAIAVAPTKARATRYRFSQATT